MGAAALSLVTFSAVLLVALAAWFQNEPQPWTWKSALTIVCVVLALVAALLIWRIPTRTHVYGGIGVMVVSLARIGGPREWGAMTFALLALTVLLIAPLVHAARKLPSGD